jgi:beta-phosphoglucomutase
MMPLEISAYIFDLDGVIVDTAKYHFLAWRRLARQLGFDFTEAQNEDLKGVSRVRSLEMILELGRINATIAEKEIMAAQKNEWYLEYIDQMTEKEVLPGVDTLLHELKAAKKKIALGSASKNARTILEKVNLTSFFDAIIDGNLVKEAKPNPEVFLTAASQLHTAAEVCVVFEDAQAGVEAALRAGMFCVGVGDQQTLQAAHLVIPNMLHMDYLSLESRLAQLRVGGQ